MKNDKDERKEKKKSKKRSENENENMRYVFTLSLSSYRRVLNDENVNKSALNGYTCVYAARDSNIGV